MICLKPELNVEIFDYLVVTGTVSENEHLLNSISDEDQFCTIIVSNLK